MSEGDLTRRTPQSSFAEAGSTRASAAASRRSIAPADDTRGSVAMRGDDGEGRPGVLDAVRGSTRSLNGGADTSANVDELTYVDRDGVTYNYYDRPLWQVCPFILLQEMCERLAYYGITPTLKPYLKHALGLDDARASSYVGWFQGIIFLPPIFSAIIADTFLGTYRTILVFSAIYACGFALWAFSALEGFGQPWMVYLSLFVLLTIGAGGIKSCINVFGGQQFHPTHHKVLLTSFFTYFYASINVGSIVGGLSVPQVAESVSYFAAYLIPLTAFCIASVIFVCGSGRYVRIKPQGSPVVSVVKVLFNAARHRSFAKCKKIHGGDFEDSLVDDTLQLLRLQPVVSMVVPLLIAYNQMTTAFLTQGEKMHNVIFGSTRFAPALMQNVDPVAVICATLVLERVVFPFCQKRDLMPNVMTRFTIGNAFGVLALVCAFAVERAVMAQPASDTVSIWWQVPQFSFIATAEVFTLSTSYEVAFTLAPQSLKTVSSACNLLFFSASGFLSGALFLIFESWMPNFDPQEPDTFRKSKYDLYYLILAGFCVIGIGLCILLRGYFVRVAQGREASAAAAAKANGEAGSLLEAQDQPAESNKATA